MYTYVFIFGLSLVFVAQLIHSLREFGFDEIGYRLTFCRCVNKAVLNPNTILYMDYGSEEFAYHRTMRRVYSDITSQLIQKGVCVESRIVPGGQHTEASWEKQLAFFMRTLLYKA